MKISAHVLLKNEENFVWYSIMSVIDYVDEILIWDTGSTDNTLKIINEINNPKMILNKISVNKLDEGSIRQMMLEKTFSDWFIILDADEVWWTDSIKLVTNTIRENGNNLESIVVPTVNVIGDIFHCQEKLAGRYNLVGKTGHMNLRAINRNISGLHGIGDHGIFMWADENNVKIEDRDINMIKYLVAPYLHATHLRRSKISVYKRSKKLKYEIGDLLPLDYYYPEVFFKDKPNIVKSPWITPNLKYKLISSIETPFKKIRRRYLMKGVPHGY